MAEKASDPEDVADMLEALARRIRGDAPPAPLVVACGAQASDVPSLGALDVFTDDTHVTVTVEALNADPASVHVSVLEGRLQIGLGDGPTAFKRDLPLPAAVDEEMAVATFRNGVLDVVLPLKHR